MNGKNIETVIEIAAKSAFGHELREVAVCRGHDADIDALRVIAAQPLEFLFL